MGVETAIAAGALAGGGASVYSATKKPKSPKLPDLPQLGEIGTSWQGATYDLIERALGGSTPWNAYGAYAVRNQEGEFETVPWAITKQSMRDNFEKSYGDSRATAQSAINRMVPAKDSAVRGYLNRRMDSDYWRGKEQLESDMAMQSEQDRQWAMSAAMDALASEKRIAAGITNMFNQQQEQNRLMEMQYGTLGSGLASGLGSLGGWSMAARLFGKEF